jgi:hypothetical protein
MVMEVSSLRFFRPFSTPRADELTLSPTPAANAERQAENDPQPEIIAQLAQEVYANDILQLLVLHIWRFEFEVRPRRSSRFGSGRASREADAVCSWP